MQLFKSPMLITMEEILKVFSGYVAVDQDCPLSIECRHEDRGYRFVDKVFKRTAVVRPAMADGKIVTEFNTDDDTPILVKLDPSTAHSKIALDIYRWFTIETGNLFDVSKNGNIPAYTVFRINHKTILR